MKTHKIDMTSLMTFFEFITLYHIVTQLRNVFSNWEHYQSGRQFYLKAPNKKGIKASHGFP